MSIQYRQGDVLLVKVADLPKGVKQAARDKADRIVLAEGEHHGHAHALRNPNVTAFFKEGAREAGSALVDFIEVGGGGANLTHEYIDGRQADHNPINVPEGTYRVIQQREAADEGVELRAFD